jgi:glycosyltransferase involved in cell wall biosynthesis
MRAIVKISLVSPVFNEEAVIASFVAAATDALSRLTDDYEILLVEDRSTDRTRSVLIEIQKKHPKLRVIFLPSNRGQHAATVLGLLESTGDLVFLIDADMQIDPMQAGLLHEKGRQSEDWDVIQGVRSIRNAGAIRSLGSRFVTRVINHVCHNRLRDPGSTFLLFRRSALDSLLHYPILSQNIQLLMGFLGLRVEEVPVESRGQDARRSSYSFFSLIELLLLAFLNFSAGQKTLRALLGVGAIACAASFAGWVAIILDGMIRQRALPTNWMLFLTMLGVSGMQFVLLGIIAFKLERINRNLDFRRMIAHKPHDL